MDVMDLRRNLLNMITHTSGGDPIPAGCEIGLFTPTENENTHTITHSLGEVPKFAYCFLVPNSAWTDIATASILVEELGADPQTGEFNTSAGTNRFRNNVVIAANNPVSQYNTSNTHTTYPASMSSTEVTFATGRYYSGQFKSGKTYLYILVK